MKTANYVKIRQAVLCNGSKMVVKIGVFYYREVWGEIMQSVVIPVLD